LECIFTYVVALEDRSSIASFMLFSSQFFSENLIIFSCRFFWLPRTKGKKRVSWSERRTRW